MNRMATAVAEYKRCEEAGRDVVVIPTGGDPARTGKTEAQAVARTLIEALEGALREADAALAADSVTEEEPAPRGRRRPVLE